MSFTIESKEREVHKKAEHIFNFLSDFHHFHGLLPEDKVENWQCTETECSFTLKGLADMAVLIKNKEEHKLIHYQSAPESKLPFDLIVHIDPKGDYCSCKVVVEVHLSKALKMFAQKPLEAFANTLVDKLEETEF